jgi:uncharacterized YccA/Bax inhibitor family protein
MRTSNPMLSDAAFRRIYASEVGTDSATMTMDGAIKKTGVLFGLLVSTALLQWYLMSVNPTLAWGTMMAGFIGGFIVAIVTVFRPQFAPVTAPVYALLEGFIIGGLSIIFEMAYPGIIYPAIGLTFGVMAMMLTLYVTRVIKVTNRFRMGVTMAIGAIFMLYLVTIVLSFFGVYVPFVFEGGPFGIAFSLFVVAIAALSLLLDFDMIEQRAAARAPKFWEWYSAFALMVTLVWLYLEILRLLAKSRQ